MQKRSRRFGVIGSIVAATCLFAALALAAGCSAPQQEESSPEALPAPQASEVEKTVELPTEPFYVLVVGDDSRENTTQAKNYEGAFSDTIMLTRVDPVNYQVTAVSIPRDTATELDGATEKINESYHRYGIKGLEEQVKLLTGIDVDYYFDMGFANFVSFIDELGGVTVNVPIDMNFKDVMSGDQIYLNAGEQELSGAEALVLSRVRKMFGGNGEACRQVSDRNIVGSIIRSVASDPSKVDAAVAALYKNADTDYPEDEFQALVDDFAAHSDDVTVYLATGPYYGDFDAYSGIWMAVRDEGTWAHIVEVMNAGDDPSGIVGAPL